MIRNTSFLPYLLMGLFLLGASQAGVAAEKPGFQLQDEPGKHLDVVYNGTTVGRYMYDLDLSSEDRRHETYKPFLHVMNPSGEQPITKGAGGRFTHHRGIFRGWAKLQLDGKRYDTWHMKNVVQEHLRFTEKKTTPEQASFTSVIRFRTDDGKVPNTRAPSNSQGNYRPVRGNRCGGNLLRLNLPFRQAKASSGLGAVARHQMPSKPNPVTIAPKPCNTTLGPSSNPIPAIHRPA